MQVDLRIPPTKDFFFKLAVFFSPFFKYNVVFEDPSKDYISDIIDMVL